MFTMLPLWGASAVVKSDAKVVAKVVATKESAMGSESSSPQYIDTAELTRSGREVSGQTPVAHFERLTEDLPEQGEAQVVSWSILGERTGAEHGAGQFFLHLHVQGEVTLQCQRCMLPLPWPFDFRSRLQVVRSEAELEDTVYIEGLDDDAPERIVGSPRLDVLELIEDEIILGLPYVPKHDVCPSAPETESGQSRPSPFAALGELKKN